MKENKLVSFLQVWGIILVVLGHSFEAYYSVHRHNFIARDWIYTFHMPLFVFISGYLFLYSIQISNRSLEEMPLWGRKGFFMKKVERLLLPYLVISTITFFPKTSLSKYAMRGVELSWESWIDMLIYPWDNVIIFFWFLPMLFFIFCVVVCAMRIALHFQWKFNVYIILLLLSVLHLFNPFENMHFLALTDVMKYLIYFVLGCFFFMKQDNLMKFFVGKKCFKILILFLLSIFFLEFHFWGSGFLASINGILLSIMLGHIYVSYNFRLFQHLNGMSYTIYLLSWFPQVLFLQILQNVYPLRWELVIFMAIVSGIYGPFCIYKLCMAMKRKYKYGKYVALIVGC